MRADVVDRVNLSVDVEKRYRLASDLDSFARSGWNLIQPRGLHKVSHMFNPHRASAESRASAGAGLCRVPGSRHFAASQLTLRFNSFFPISRVDVPTTALCCGMESS